MFFDENIHKDLRYCKLKLLNSLFFALVFILFFAYQSDFFKYLFFLIKLIQLQFYLLHKIQRTFLTWQNSKIYIVNYFYNFHTISLSKQKQNPNIFNYN